MAEVSRDHDEIWIGDFLGRRQDAQYLGNFLSSRFQLKPKEPGFVLAVDGEWGFGKSFMIKRWQEELAFQNCPTVFFNAWENDYVGDPLLAFISELDTGLQDFFEKIPMIVVGRQKLLETLKKSWKPVLKELAFAASKKAIGFGAKELHDALEISQGGDEDAEAKDADGDFGKVTPEMQKAIDKALNEHKTTKNAIAEFKKKLETLIDVLQDEAGIQLPIFIFVDELDRCRPDYAIELLEGIKHLFGIRGVYFVVATNTIQLGESVKAVYGGGFDGQRYLKRFFDLQYTLPEPNNLEFARSLFSGMEVIKKLDLVHCLDYLEGFGFNPSTDDANLEALVRIFSTYANAFAIGLRDQKQIVEMLEASFIQLKVEKIHIFFLLFLACTYHQDRAAFNSIARFGIKDEKVFDKVRGAAQNGKINYYVFSDHQRKNVERDTNLIEIASVYFSRREIPYDQFASLGSNREFPQVLMRGVEGQKDGKFIRPYFFKYFDVIKHAGGFKDRSGTKKPEN
nr:P-loop NTPase fold protein [uncultured Undibacterium sp.]